MQVLPFLALFALVAAPAATARAEGPSWYNKKKQDESEKKEEEAQKESEAPVVGGDSGDMGADTGQLAPIAGRKEEKKPVVTSHFFKASGLTDSIGLGGGYLSQPDLPGKFLSFDYSMGWWANPELAVSPYLQGFTALESSYIFVLFGAGIKIRYFLTKNWPFSGYFGWGLSQGFSRTPQSVLPYPPNQDQLAARRGTNVSLQAAYLYWSKRTFGIGPSFTVTFGSQTERTFFAFSLGMTFQSGRPNFVDDLTAW